MTTEAKTCGACTEPIDERGYCTFCLTYHGRYSGPFTTHDLSWVLVRLCVAILREVRKR